MSSKLEFINSLMKDIWYKNACLIQLSSTNGEEGYLVTKNGGGRQYSDKRHSSVRANAKLTQMLWDILSEDIHLCYRHVLWIYFHFICDIINNDNEILKAS